MSKKQSSYWYGIASIAALAIVLAAAARAQDNAGRNPVQPSLLALMAAPLAPEPAAGEKTGGQSAEEPGPLQEVFHWFNFLILASGIGYLIKKFLVPFLIERSKLIREDMDISRRTLAEADQRLAVVEGKLKHLDEELAALRQAASQEALAERQRIEEAASADAARILTAAEQEIDASVKAARQQLKQYAAELAVGVAESKIRASLTPQSEQRILREFVSDLAGGNGQPSAATPGKHS